MVKRDLLENYKTAFFGLLTTLSIFSFIIVMTTVNGNQFLLTSLSNKMYIIGFFIVGLFFSGMAFKDFRNKEKTMSYLMLPASSLEKLLSMLFLTNIAFLISYTILFGVFNLLNIALVNVFPGDLHIVFYNPFNLNVWKAYLIFLPIQAVFLAGAATFKKVPIFYTALYTFILGLIFIFVISFIARYLFDDFLKTFDVMPNASFQFHLNDGASVDFNSFPIDIVKFFFNYLVAPVFWIIAWFKIKEKEV